MIGSIEGQIRPTFRVVEAAARTVTSNRGAGPCKSTGTRWPRAREVANLCPEKRQATAALAPRH